MRATSLSLRTAAAGLCAAMLLATVGVTEARAVSDDAIKVMVEVALGGAPESLEASIKAIFDGVAPGDAGAAAAAVLAASEDASLTARKAVGRALTGVSRSLASKGEAAGARAVVSAMEAASAGGNNAALAVYTKTAKATSPPVSTGADGAGVNTLNVSTSE